MQSRALCPQRFLLGQAHSGEVNAWKQPWEARLCCGHAGVAWLCSSGPCTVSRRQALRGAAWRGVAAACVCLDGFGMALRGFVRGAALQQVLQGTVLPRVAQGCGCFVALQQRGSRGLAAGCCGAQQGARPKYVLNSGKDHNRPSH